MWAAELTHRRSRMQCASSQPLTVHSLLAKTSWLLRILRLMGRVAHVRTRLDTQCHPGLATHSGVPAGQGRSASARGVDS